MQARRHAPTVIAGIVLALLHAAPAGAEDAVDEIHYSYGDAAGSVVVHWRGAETAIAYGPSTAYGFSAVAGPPAVLPVDSPGPFREVTLSGLAPDTEYHYRIGEGADHVLRTAPTGSFRWVDVGDTASTACKSWMTQVHALIARLGPRFVTHGGDISEANVCGVPAVHAYYEDQAAWSVAAAFQPVWGNHEFGYPSAGAPAGTPRDSLANYKGRSHVTNGQAVSLDTATRTTPPGCAGPVNACPGEDWGWFRAGGVVFLSYPEIWTGALASWQPVADRVMADAQADPTVDFVVTYGHRPAYSSQSTNGWDPTVRSALDALAAEYSPGPDRPAGKYVLNLAHHVHALEVFGPIDGLTHVTNATGGQGTVSLPAPVAGSLLRFSHLGVLAGDYDAAARRLSLRWVCGPTIGTKDTCGYGDTVWSTAFQAGGGASPEPCPGVSTGGVGAPTCPAPTPVVTPTPTPTPTPTGSGTPTATGVPTGTPAATGTPGASATTTSGPAATDGPGPAPGPPLPPPGPSGSPVLKEWVGNAGLERDLTGWGGRYGAAPAVSVARVTSDAHGGRASVRVAAGPGAKDLTSGFNDAPRWVTRTVAGGSYTASAWVRPKATGQEIVVRLREWSSGGSPVTDRTATLRAASTRWQKVSVQLRAVGSGGGLSMAVYAKDLDAGEWFLADDLSLAGA
jgi:hypothetical protein